MQAADEVSIGDRRARSRILAEKNPLDPQSDGFRGILLRPRKLHHLMRHVTDYHPTILGSALI